jgi:hypothetical protein
LYECQSIYRYIHFVALISEGRFVRSSAAPPPRKGRPISSGLTRVVLVGQWEFPAVIILSDVQTEAISNVARPLQPQERQAFMAALFEALLNRRDGLGEGSLARLLKDLQRKHFRPPAQTEDTRQRARERAFTARAERYTELSYPFQRREAVR